MQPKKSKQGCDQLKEPGAAVEQTISGVSRQLPTPEQAIPDADKPLQDANYTWVQCDLCDKWRELPKGSSVRSWCAFEWVLVSDKAAGLLLATRP